MGTLHRNTGIRVIDEAACCFVLAMQWEQRALLDAQRFERIAGLERRIFEHAFAAFDQVEQQLGAVLATCAVSRTMRSPMQSARI